MLKILKIIGPVLATINLFSTVATGLLGPVTVNLFGLVTIDSLALVTISLVGAGFMVILLLIHHVVYTKLYDLNPVLTKFIDIVAKAFSLKNILFMLTFAFISWNIRTLIACNFDLDVNTLVGFTSVVVPAGLISSVVKDFTMFVIDSNTLKVGNPDPSSKFVHFSSANTGSVSGLASGSGSGSGSGSRSGTGSGTGSGSASRSVTDAAVKQVAIDNYARVNANSLQNFANSPGDPGFFVQDGQGIGARGYVHGGINQPYASQLAAALKNQGVSGKTYHPKLDSTAKRFLATALPHIRPEVYGPQPNVTTNASMIVQSTIRKLERMP